MSHPTGNALARQSADSEFTQPSKAEESAAASVIQAVKLLVRRQLLALSLRDQDAV